MFTIQLTTKTKKITTNIKNHVTTETPIHRNKTIPGNITQCNTCTYKKEDHCQKQYPYIPRYCKDYEQ